MNVPNAGSAVVEEDKLVNYLLNPRHRYGASKAQFFFPSGLRQNIGMCSRKLCKSTDASTK